MEMRNTEKALHWIVGLLRKHEIPFQIAGGFAARLYGSPRELADIDIGIPDNRFADIYPDIKDYLTFGPAQYTDEVWDLQLMTVVYAGQEIDIAGEDTIKWFDKANHSWAAGRCDFLNYEMKEIYGLSIPVMPKEAHIAHKKKLMRDVDKEDADALANEAMDRGLII
ncbi:MAG: hypothetical protein Q8L30_01890 [bacterium]|nr:hypothetical protein [bacterium]